MLHNLLFLTCNLSLIRLMGGVSQSLLGLGVDGVRSGQKARMAEY